MTVDLISALKTSAEAIMRADGDRDHMNPSNLTCEQTQSISRIITAAADGMEQMRNALVVVRSCVLESFDHVETADDHMLADARLRDIDDALSRIGNGEDHKQ